MVTTLKITNKKDWETFLLARPESNFLQSWAWGEFHEELGNKIFRVGFYRNKILSGIMLCILEKAKRANYVTVPGGPIIDWNDKKIVQSFRSEIVRIGKKNDCSFVRVRPQLENSKFSNQLFKNLGFRSSPMHLHAELTNQLDITKSENELLAQMRKGTRYEIRKALKLEIKVEKSSGEGEIKHFYKLQLETSKRQGFVPFSYKYLSGQFKIFSNSNHAVLYSAYLGKKLLAQAFVIFYGNEAVYHYGASTILGRKYPGAYLVQWVAILEAKKRGIGKYNFWGVAKEKNHRFSNLSMFKRGFGGVDFEYQHAQDLVISKPKYLVNYLIEIIRKKIRHI